MTSLLAQPDSAEFSKLQELAGVDDAVEKEFEGLRSKLEGKVNSPLYPPLETIERLAAILALDLGVEGKPPPR